jgi:predicted nucleic acid-binding protein
MTYRPRVLLADATVLYSALVYRGLENRVLFSGDYIFVTTEFTIAEIYRVVATKRRLGSSEGQALIRSMPVLVANNDILESKLNEANELIGKRDKSDIPLVALALALKAHDGIWSSDKDFDVVKGRFKVWKTRELLKA